MGVGDGAGVANSAWTALATVPLSGVKISEYRVCAGATKPNLPRAVELMTLLMEMEYLRVKTLSEAGPVRLGTLHVRPKGVTALPGRLNSSTTRFFSLLTQPLEAWQVKKAAWLEALEPGKVIV